MRSTLRRVALIGMAGFGLALTSVGAAGASTSTAAPNAQDRAWLVAAHQSNLTEIAAGKAAQAKATTQVVKEHGELFIRDHTRLDANLTRVAQQLNVDLPSTPNAKQQSTLASVSAKSGAAFDAAWLTSQVAGHREAKAAGAKELAAGGDATVKNLASAAAPVVQSHLSMLETATGQSPSGANAGTGGQAATEPGGMRLGWTFMGLALIAGAGALALVRPRRATR